MGKKVKLRINHLSWDMQPFIIACMILPFFESYVISMLISHGIEVKLWSLVDNIFTAWRLIIVTYVYGNVIQKIAKKQLSISKVSIALILFLIMQVFACLINGSFTSNMLVGAYSYAGFVLLCEYLSNKSQDIFLKGVKLLFGWAAIAGGILIILFPNGFFNASDKAYAYYLLGSKNSTFFYYFLYLEATLCWNLTMRHRLPPRFTLIVAFMLLTVFVCDSANSIICITMLFAFYLLAKHGRRIAKWINPTILACVILIFGIMVYTGKNMPIINSIIVSLGRNASFTGRDALWADAIGKIMDSPIWGSGADSIFLLSYGAEATHAHSFILDTWSKYGIVTLLPYLAALFFVIKRIVRCHNKMVVYLLSAILFVASLHILFDVPTNYYLILMLIMLSSTADYYSAGIVQRNRR